MENNPLISIIIPIYNVAEHLSECVDSVLCQSFKDFEVILVNDGSSDNSPEICDSYAKKDSRVKVIHKENGGVSDARNKGMHAARGEYLLFIDGDDFIEYNSLEALIKILSTDGKTDIVLLNSSYYFNADGKVKRSGDFIDKSRLYGKSHNDVLKYISSFSNISTSACLKLIKRELTESYGISFAGVWGEDIDFCASLYLCAKSYNYCAGYMYYYRKGRKNSLTSSFTEKKFEDLLRVIIKWARVLKSGRDGSELLGGYFAFQYCLLISGYGRIRHRISRKNIKQIKELAWLLSLSNDWRVMLVRNFYKIFGLRLTSIIYGIYERMASRR